MTTFDIKEKSDLTNDQAKRRSQVRTHNDDKIGGANAGILICQ